MGVILGDNKKDKCGGVHDGEKTDSDVDDNVIFEKAEKVENMTFFPINSEWQTSRCQLGY